MTKSVLIPQQVEEPKQKKRSGFSRVFEAAAPTVGTVVGGALGGPVGAAAGGMIGQQFGGQIGDAAAPGTVVGGGMVGAGFKEAPAGSAIQRRQEALTKDPLTTLQEAQAALALRSPDEQKQYGPALEQAMNEARRERGYV